MARAARAALLLTLAWAPCAAAGDPDPPPQTWEATRIETSFGPVYRGASAPADHYAERYAEGAYWLPGVVEGTSLVRKVIRAARARRGAGEAVALRRHPGTGVWVSPGPPFPGVHYVGLGPGYAWIAGVLRPDPDQREALAAAAPSAAGGEPAVTDPDN